MVKSYTLAAGAALTLGVNSVTFAYSGDLDIGGPALPVMMQFDAGPTTAVPLDATGKDSHSTATDNKPSPPSSARQVAAKAARDEFQRYFDRHYRAHLVLDASAHRFFEVE